MSRRLLEIFHRHNRIYPSSTRFEGSCAAEFMMDQLLHTPNANWVHGEPSWRRRAVPGQPPQAVYPTHDGVKIQVADGEFMEPEELCPRSYCIDAIEWLRIFGEQNFDQSWVAGFLLMPGSPVMKTPFSAAPEYHMLNCAILIAGLNHQEYRMTSIDTLSPVPTGNPVRFDPEALFIAMTAVGLARCSQDDVDEEELDTRMEAMVSGVNAALR